MPYRVRHIWVCSASGLGRHDVPFKQTLFQKNHLGPVLAILPCIAPPSQPSLIHHRHTPPITTASRHPATRPPGPHTPQPPTPTPHTITSHHHHIIFPAVSLPYKYKKHDDRDREKKMRINMCWGEDLFLTSTRSSRVWRQHQNAAFRGDEVWFGSEEVDAAQRVGMGICGREYCIGKLKSQVRK